MQLQIPLTLLSDNPWQPRLSTDDAHVANLAASIQRDGLLQVPLGRVVDADGKPLQLSNILTTNLIIANSWQVQLAFGHSRLKAYLQLAETNEAFGSMPIELRPLTDEQMANFAWSENAARKDLNPLEEAQAIAKRLADFKWTHARCAEEMGLERSVISNKLRMLKLPTNVQEQVRGGALSQRQALALVPLLDLPEATFEAFKGTWRDPATIYASAPSDSAETIRARVKNAIEHLTESLERAAWNLDDEFAGEGIFEAACRTCDQRLKTQNRCPLKACFDAKAAQAKARQLAAAAAAAGLPAEGRKLEYNERTTFYQEGIQKKLIREGCPKGNLRVIGGSAERPEIACVHGARKRCACLAAIERADTKTRETKAAEGRVAALQILQPIIDGIVTALQNIDNRPLLLALAERLNYSILGDAKKKNWSTAQIAEAMALSMISYAEYQALHGELSATKALPKLREKFNLLDPAAARAGLLVELDQFAEGLEVVEQAPPMPEQAPRILATMRTELDALAAALKPDADGVMVAHLGQLDARLARLEREARGDPPAIAWAPREEVAAVFANTSPALAEQEA